MNADTARKSGSSNRYSQGTSIRSGDSQAQRDPNPPALTTSFRQRILVKAEKVLVEHGLEQPTAEAPGLPEGRGRHPTTSARVADLQNEVLHLVLAERQFELRRGLRRSGARKHVIRAAITPVDPELELVVTHDQLSHVSVSPLASWNTTVNRTTANPQCAKCCHS